METDPACLMKVICPHARDQKKKTLPETSSVIVRIPHHVKTCSDVISSYMANKLISVAAMVFAAMMLFVSCHNDMEQTFVQIDYNSFNSVRIVSPDAIDGLPLRSFTLEETSYDYMISSADKIIIKDSISYILDQSQRKIVSFNMSGRPLSFLARKGRGPMEYLQISDFDVDGKGNIFILDGQKNKVFEYDKTGIMVSSSEIPFEASYIKILEDRGFAFGISAWDYTYPNDRIVLTDKRIRPVKSISKRESPLDPNFQFFSIGFSCLKNGDCFYNYPIDDYVTVLDNTGNLKEAYYMDFGGKATPEELRNSIEAHLDRINGCRFLVKGIVVTDNWIVGCVREGKMSDFVIDRKNKIRYDIESHSGLGSMAGLSDGYAIFITETDDGSKLLNLLSIE